MHKDSVFEAVSLRLLTPTRVLGRLAGHVKGTARMGYKVHYVVDGGKAREIFTALVTKVDVKDNQPMLDLLWHTNFRWKLRPHHVTGDSVYGTIPNVKAIEQAGIRAYMPVIDYTWGKKTLFRKDDFNYDAERDVYWCPAGETLRNTGARKKLRLIRYVADPEVCNACPLKSKCTEGKSGRAVNRNFDEYYFEKVKGYYELEAYKKAMRKRKVWIEPMFGEAKQWHGMERVRLRRLEKVNAEVLITAAGQNIKRLLTFRGRGPRKLAQAAALRPPERLSLRLDHRRSVTNFPSPRSHSPGFSTRCPEWYRYALELVGLAPTEFLKLCSGECQRAV